jgi:3-hydroxyisobutyrate dehydrogenase
MSAGGRVGIVGVGNMGGAMAANLLAGGWVVGVRDLSAERERALAQLGAAVHDTPAQAASGVSALIVCVVDAAQCDEVLFGAQGVSSADRLPDTVMLCPTIAPGDAVRLAQRLAVLGMASIDAPMSGGPARARDGSMSLMVACPDAVFERHAALLAALSNKVLRVSRKPGDGARTKLVNNLLAGINLVGAAEVLALAERMGLDTATTLGVIEQSSGQSWIGSDRLRRALAGDFEPRAHVTLLQKDTRLACEAARACDFDGPLGAAAAAVFEQAANAGFASEDDAALFKLLSGRLPTMQG